MIAAHIKVSGVYATCVRRTAIPAGLIGGQVSVEYVDPIWEGMTKIAVFRGSVTKDVLSPGKLITIPAEVVEKSGVDVYFGIYGVDAEGVTAIPLIEAYLGRTKTATDPSGDTSTDPMLPFWAQLQAQIDALCKAGVSEEAIAAAVQSYLMTHPAGYILTEDDKAEIAGMAAELVEVPDSGTNVAVSVEPAEGDIPKIFFGGALQQTKDEAVVPFRYISKTDDFSGYAEIKAQGNSSMSYPKKNQTGKMFKDEACESKMKVDFKGWGNIA